MERVPKLSVSRVFMGIFQTASSEKFDINMVQKSNVNLGEFTLMTLAVYLLLFTFGCL